MVTPAAGIRFALLLSFFAAATGVLTPGVPAEAAALQEEDPGAAVSKTDAKTLDDCEKIITSEKTITKKLNDRLADQIRSFDVEDMQACAAQAAEVKIKADIEKELDKVPKEEQKKIEKDLKKCADDKAAKTKWTECLKEADAEKCAKTAMDDSVQECQEKTEEKIKQVIKEAEEVKKAEPAEIKTQKDKEGVKNAGLYQCTKRDKISMFGLGGGSAPGSFPHSMARCANQAFQIFTGLNYTSFGLCMEKETRITKGCAACFAGASASQAFWCGGACMFSWCSQPCLACTWAYRATHLKSCVGFAAPEPQSC